MAQIENMSEGNMKDLINVYDEMKGKNPDVSMKLYNYTNLKSPEDIEKKTDEHDSSKSSIDSYKMFDILNRKLNRIMIVLNIAPKDEILNV